MRPLRTLPPGENLVEVTTRTLQGFCLLKPDPEVRETILGVLARALRLYDVKLCADVFLSNHYHLLLRVQSAEQLSTFMKYLNGNLSKKVGKLIGWSGSFWSGRFHSVPVSHEAEAQEARLRYLLAHGCKEGLVREIRQWPGPHAGPALAGNGRLDARWSNETRRCRDRHRGGEKKAETYLEDETIHYTPLPCWDGLDADTRRRKVRDMIGEIETEAASRLRRTGTSVLGAPAILRQDPFQRIDLKARRPLPRIHAASRHARDRHRAWLEAQIEAYRRASARYRSGNLTAEFPPDTCRPPGPHAPAFTAAC